MTILIASISGCDERGMATAENFNIIGSFESNKKDEAQAFLNKLTAREVLITSWKAFEASVLSELLSELQKQYPKPEEPKLEEVPSVMVGAGGSSGEERHNRHTIKQKNRVLRQKFQTSMTNWDAMVMLMLQNQLTERYPDSVNLTPEEWNRAKESYTRKKTFILFEVPELNSNMDIGKLPSMFPIRGLKMPF